MGLFSGIFDGIDDGVNSLFGTDLPDNISNGTANALGKTAIAGAGLLIGGSSSPQVQAGTQSRLNSDERIEGTLSRGTIPLTGKIQTQVPTHTEDSFKADKSVDADTLDSEWNGRLATYANLVRNSRYQ